MVYDWDRHKDVCYNLYIQERKSLEDIMQHMRDNYSFTPSKRAFQTQFKRWQFPSKQNPAHRNIDLVSRVKELWEQNYSQRDMLKTLTDEGFRIKERELMRVRAKNRWLLRIPNGTKSTPEEDAFQAELLEAVGVPREVISKESVPPPVLDVPEEVIRKRKQRHEQLQKESDELWAAKKRRRRTRAYAGIAADPQGPPRFPSETTLGESMEFLSLTPQLYKDIRARFQQICEEDGIMKKTLAGTDKWQAAKDRLIQESAHLKTVFWDGSNRQAKELALDVICTDVTKRIRTIETRMTIVVAKNTLGINPEQSRRIRNGFFSILQDDHFTSKLEIGQDHWQELKNEWISKTPILQEILASGTADPQHDQKQKALEVLCRDVMKRLRDIQKKHNGVGSSGVRIGSDASNSESQTIDQLQHTAITAQNFDNIADLQIDPSLLEVADNQTPDIPLVKSVSNTHEEQLRQWLQRNVPVDTKESVWKAVESLEIAMRNGDIQGLLKIQRTAMTAGLSVEVMEKVDELATIMANSTTYPP